MLADDVSSTYFFKRTDETTTCSIAPSLLLVAVSTCFDVGSARIPKGARNRCVHPMHMHALVTQLNVDTCKECKHAPT